MGLSTEVDLIRPAKFEPEKPRPKQIRTAAHTICTYAKIR
jgi:hypothetical protein